MNAAMMAEIGSFPMIDVMNHYFDCMAEAVWAEGGEILKFMGDAMLVVFRLDDERDAPAVAQSAVRAAQVALQNLATLSESRVQNGELPLHAGVSVHLGHVVYGNIGDDVIEKLQEHCNNPDFVPEKIGKVSSAMALHKSSVTKSQWCVASTGNR